ncbi:hypothetical protein Y1Q_0006987 [Alligator mississippiensis]|uniref:Cytochrome P450 2G1-like n=1 Tax=Alligator mississippiensis TaxID=8496 RepID=A0A151P6Y5_ALLMI|nr:hypothetical protein Y1Q_0006987 [Alligator mississippiensis]
MIFWQQKQRQKPGKLPPGPTLLQILGYWLQLKQQGLNKLLTKIREKHGPVFTVNTGQRQIVFLCDLDSVREALVHQGQKFSGRAVFNSIDGYFQGHGIAATDGEEWEQLRRFSTSTLRNFGMGKRSIEERVEAEAQHLAEEIGKAEGSPFDPTLIVTHAVSNVICSIVFGNRFDYKDQKFLALMNATHGFLVDISSIWSLFCKVFPRTMQYIPSPHSQLYHHYKAIHDFIMERVKMNQQSLDPSCPRDFIDSFLIRMEEKSSQFDTLKIGRKLVIDPVVSPSPSSPFDPTLIISHAVSNDICSIVFGICFDYQDQKFLTLMGAINNFFSDLSSIWSLLQNRNKGMLEILQKVKEKYGPVFTVNFGPRHLVYFCDSNSMREALVDQATEFNGRARMESLDRFFHGHGVILANGERINNLFLDLSKISTVFYEMFPRIMQYIPGPHNRACNHYKALHNFILERVRINQQSLDPRCPRDFIDSFLIRMEEDTDVYMILGILLQDPKYFKDPKSFHPEHFLDEEGHFKRNDSFLPFGTGKRVCLGKSLALMELFLMLTTILQRFTLKSPKEPQEIDLTPKVNELGIVPPNYELYALPREEGLHDSA